MVPAGAPWSLLGCPEEHVGQRWEAEFFKVKRATSTSLCCGHWSKCISDQDLAAFSVRASQGLASTRYAEGSHAS